MKEFIVRKQVKIKAGPAEVWDALTDPDKTRKYFFGSRVFSDWKPGSSITFKGRLFYLIKFEMSGKILEIQPRELLKYNLKNAKSSSTSVVTDQLSYEDGITTLSITDDVGQGEGAEKRFNRSQKGWDKILHGLKKMLEKSPA